MESKDKKPEHDENELEGKEPSVDSSPASEITPAGGDGVSKAKKAGPLKRFFQRFNVYLLAFVFLLVIGAAYAVVTYLSSKKVPEQPTIATQELTQETLEQLSKGDATVGNATSVLNIQSNAVFAGQVLIGGDLNVAGTLKLGKPLSVPEITVSGTSNLSTVQINTLQVAQDVTVQGNTILQKNLNVGGSADFNGSVRTGNLTASNLTLSGSGAFTLNGRIVAGGATPSRTPGGALGSGGTVTNSGADMAGIVNINTGGGGGNGCFVTINFTSKFNVAPYIALTPASADAASVNYYILRTTNNFQICAVGAVSSKNLAFTYIVID
jgi:hypothetical protein